MSKNKIALAGVASAVMGFLVQGCFAAQPSPECNVITGQAVFALSNYWATLEKTGSTGTCTDAPSSKLSVLEVGMTRFAPPDATQHTVAIRNSYLVDVYNGLVYAGNQDPTNDCSKTSSPGKCKFCIASGSAASCDAKFIDGGNAIAFLADGGHDVATQSDGGVGPCRGIIYDGGTRVSLTNTCGVTEEQIPRVDPNDMDGKNIDQFANIPLYPDKAGVCTLSSYTGGVQNLQAEPLVGGGELPAIKLSEDWTDFNIINNTKAPGTYWTAKLTLTEGSCATTYNTVAFWPIVTCGVLDDQGAVALDSNNVPLGDETQCDVNANLDAGHVTGSGLSPFFKAHCRTDVLDWAGRPVCVPTATAADLTK